MSEAGNPDAAARPLPLAIIGGGAAGMAAAVFAAARGIACLVFERKARLGAKVLMTANGRCNFTKDIPPGRMLEDIGGEAAEFLAPAVRAFPPERIAGWLRSLGVRAKRMTDGRLFPASEKAADVVHAFGDFLRERSSPIAVNCRVTGVRRAASGFLVETAGFSVPAAAVLIATGGVSFPKTGSTGDGLDFARSLGMEVTPLAAGLTGFDAKLPPGCRPGRVLETVCRVKAHGETKFEWRGEVEFDAHGASGAAVYNCQRWMAHHRTSAGELEVVMPEGLWRPESPAVRPLKEAIVTVGGVALGGVDPRTMEAKAVPGLYFAGEVLDVDGPTGGYNLSIAFATARLAVESIAAKTDCRPAGASGIMDGKADSGRLKKHGYKRKEGKSHGKFHYAKRKW